MKRLIVLSLVTISFSLLISSCVKKCECPQPQEKTLNLASGNLNANPDIAAARWTYGSAGEGTNRTYIKFPGLSELSQNATIKSAKLSLYGVSSGVAAPQGNSYYPASPYYSYGDNKTWLKRVLGDWDESTITWNNKPATTDLNQVEVPASTSQWNFNVLDIDVTQLVRDMISNNQRYGFVLQLQNEAIYRSIIFASSEVSDATKRPKLVVVYQ